QRAKKGDPQSRLYTRLDGRDVLLFDPIALDPTGKTKLGSVVPNRDASKLAVGVYAKGSEIQDFQIIDSRTGAPIGKPITGLDGFGWAPRERHADFVPPPTDAAARRTRAMGTSSRARRNPMRSRSRTAAIATGSAVTARTTSC